jgi:dihydrodipicolinate synthase/N-acetylneuraminate lyase
MSFDIIVPALSFRSDAGGLDVSATARYAERAAGTWINRFILSGSTTRGDLLSISERASILDLWLQVAPPSRLIACCWCESDFQEARDRGIQPMAIMKDLHTSADALRFLGELPAGALVYSHPMYSQVILDPALAGAAQQTGQLPRGAKLAKISLDQVTQMRKAVGPDFLLWDGSARHVEASIAAGASGVIATPLSALPRPFPDHSLPEIQETVDRIQADLDQLPSRSSRTEFLLKSGLEALSTLC